VCDASPLVGLYHCGRGARWRGVRFVAGIEYRSFWQLWLWSGAEVGGQVLKSPVFDFICYLSFDEFFEVNVEMKKDVDELLYVVCLGIGVVVCGLSFAVCGLWFVSFCGFRF